MVYRRRRASFRPYGQRSYRSRYYRSKKPYSKKVEQSKKSTSASARGKSSSAVRGDTVQEQVRAFPEQIPWFAYHPDGGYHYWRMPVTQAVSIPRLQQIPHGKKLVVAGVNIRFKLSYDFSCQVIGVCRFTRPSLAPIVMSCVGSVPTQFTLGEKQYSNPRLLTVDEIDVLYKDGPFKVKERPVPSDTNAPSSVFELDSADRSIFGCRQGTGSCGPLGTFKWGEKRGKVYSQKFYANGSPGGVLASNGEHIELQNFLDDKPVSFTCNRDGAVIFDPPLELLFGVKSLSVPNHSRPTNHKEMLEQVVPIEGGVLSDFLITVYCWATISDSSSTVVLSLYLLHGMFTLYSRSLFLVANCHDHMTSSATWLRRPPGLTWLRGHLRRRGLSPRPPVPSFSLSLDLLIPIH